MKQKIAIIVSILFMIFGFESNSLAQWIKTNGPYGGAKVTSMATIGTNLFAVADGDIVRSTDEGISWSIAMSGLTQSSVSAIASCGSVLFAGSVNSYNGPVFISIDSGTTWTPESSLATIGPFAAVGSNLFAGTGQGVFRSGDNGTTWIPQNTGLYMYYPSLYDIVETLNYLEGIDTLLFASTDNGFLRSSDYGITWGGVDSAKVMLSGAGGFIRNGTDLIAGGNSTDTLGHIYQSSDNGMTWKEITNNLKIQYLIGFAANGNNLFAGSWNTGVSRSTDDGVNWTPVHGGIIDSGITAITMSGNNVFVSAYGIFRSTDNGSTWKSANRGVTDSNITSLAAFGTTLFAGGWTAANGSYQSGAVYRSLDQGATWVKVFNDYCTNFFAVGSTIFANRYSDFTVIKSTDNGSSWSTLTTNSGIYNLSMNLTAAGPDLFGWMGGTRNTGYTEYDVSRSTDLGNTWNEWAMRYIQGPIGALAVIGSNIFAASPQTELFPGGVFRSSDNGAHWIQSNPGLTDTLVNAFATLGSTLFAGTAHGAFLSTDLGRSWTPASSGLLDSNISFFGVVGNTVFAVTVSGLFRSSDSGASWIQIQNKLLSLPITSLASIDQSLFAGNVNGIYVSNDDGNHWTSLGIKSPDIGALGLSGQYLFAGGTRTNTSSQGGIFRSSDNGQTWFPSDSGLSAPTSVSSFASIGSFLFAAGAAKESYYDPTGGVFRSTDFGNSWDTVFGGIGALAINGTNVFTGSGFFDGCSQSYLYGNVFSSADSGGTWIETDLGLSGAPVFALAANEGNLFASTKQNIFESNDNGADWFEVKSNLEPNTFAFIGSAIFAGGQFGVYRSTDDAVTWKQVNNGLADTNVNALIATQTKLFAATNTGLLYSNDSGNHWMNMSAGLPNTAILSVLVTPNYLFVGTAGDAVWSRILSDFPIEHPLSVGNMNDTPPIINLSPNPTTGIITIHNAPENIQLVIVSNLLGETVLKLPQPTSSDFTLDLSKLPPGTYFARFALANKVITRKILKE